MSTLIDTVISHRLSFRTRMETNDQLLSQDNLEVVGNNNDVHGKNCIVVGKYNSVYGVGCTIFGQDNEVYTNQYFDYGVNTMEYKKVGRNFVLVSGEEKKLNDTTGTIDLFSSHSSEIEGDIGVIDLTEEPISEPINVQLLREFTGFDTMPVSEVKVELVRNLQKHKDSIDSDTTQKCCICMENRSIIAFNCGHKKTCKNCSVKVIEDDCRCPFCRESIVAAIRIFD